MSVKTDGMTNTQILNSNSGAFLTANQKQVRFVMSMELKQMPCPNCGEPHNLPQAAGLEIDDFNFDTSANDRVGRCRKCRRTLIFVLMMIGGWHWRLDPNEAMKPKGAQIEIEIELNSNREERS
jgi:hypothetical protein